MRCHCVTSKLLMKCHLVWRRSGVCKMSLCCAIIIDEMSSCVKETETICLFFFRKKQSFQLFQVVPRRLMILVYIPGTFTICVSPRRPFKDFGFVLNKAINPRFCAKEATGRFRPFSRRPFTSRCLVPEGLFKNCCFVSGTGVCLYFFPSHISLLVVLCPKYHSSHLVLIEGHSQFIVLCSLKSPFANFPWSHSEVVILCQGNHSQIVALCPEVLRELFLCP